MSKSRIGNMLVLNVGECFTTDTLSTTGIDIRSYLGSAIGLEIVLAGAGTNSVSLAYSISTDNVTFRTPLNSGLIDVSDIIDVGSEITATTFMQFSPNIAPFLKFTFTGSATNGVATTITMKLVMQADN